MNKEYSNIKPLIEKEEDHLHNILPQEDVAEFKNMVGELRDTWTKKQIFRTETEARISVLQDLKYPTKAAKYWQCVREQNVFLENLMTLSFDYRRTAAKIKQLKKKVKEETNEYKKELYQIDLDEKIYNQASSELVAKIMQNKAKTLTEGSSQPEVFNVVGQLETIKRVKKDNELGHNKRQAIPSEGIGAVKPK